MLSVHAGVGGIAGGTEKFQRGNAIHFQEFSTWVNVLYSKSLCQTAYDFEAELRQCAEWKNDSGDRKCIRWIKVPAVQPKESKRERCKRFEDDKCVEWVEVDYVQSPKKIYEEKDDDGDVKKRLKVIVPKCK
jgi:hypothetical protein